MIVLENAPIRLVIVIYSAVWNSVVFLPIGVPHKFIRDLVLELRNRSEIFKVQNDTVYARASRSRYRDTGRLERNKCKCVRREQGCHTALKSKTDSLYSNHSPIQFMSQIKGITGWCLT